MVKIDKQNHTVIEEVNSEEVTLNDKTVLETVYGGLGYICSEEIGKKILCYLLDKIAVANEILSPQ